MKAILVLLALTSIVTGIKYDGFFVKYGPTSEYIGTKNFFSLPRTIQEAESQGFHITERPLGLMMELKMYCPPGRMVCPLFHAAGFVAGLQIAAPIDAIHPDLQPELYFVKWSAPIFGTEPAKDFWTATQYYVSEDTLRAGGPTAGNGDTLQSSAVWLKGVKGNLVKIPTSEAELRKTIFKKQNCVPNMGTHYYHNMTRQLSCKPPLLPWFPLITQGELLGVGFQSFGAKPTVTTRDWYEDIPRYPRTVPLRAIPDAPECFLNISQEYGRLSIHIYYISKPWELTCEPGDSIEDANVTTGETTIGVPKSNVTTKNGSRFANHSGDEIQKYILMVLSLAWLSVWI